MTKRTQNGGDFSFYTLGMGPKNQKKNVLLTHLENDQKNQNGKIIINNK
jgi:hypothetical protein